MTLGCTCIYNWNWQPQIPQTYALGNYCTKILVLLGSSNGYQSMIKEFPITE